MKIADNLSSNPLEWPDHYNMRRSEASALAAALGFPYAAATLAKQAVNGDGPEITYFGKLPTYNVAKFKAHLNGRTRHVRSTAELRRVIAIEAAA